MNFASSLDLVDILKVLAIIGGAFLLFKGMGTNPTGKDGGGSGSGHNHHHDNHNPPPAN